MRTRKHLLEQRLDDEERSQATGGARAPHALLMHFGVLKVWVLSLIYFGMVMVNYGISFWLPQIVKETLSRNSLTIGFLTAIPWALAAVTMVAVGHHSDKTGERRWHIALTSIVCSAAFAASAIPGISGTLSFLAINSGDGQHCIVILDILGITDNATIGHCRFGRHRLD